MVKNKVTALVMLALIGAIGISVIVTFNLLNSNRKLTTSSRADESGQLLARCPGEKPCPDGSCVGITESCPSSTKPTDPPSDTNPTDPPSDTNPTDPPSGGSCSSGCDSCRNGQRTCQAPCNSGCCTRTESCGDEDDGGSNPPTPTGTIAPTVPPITSKPATFTASCVAPGSSVTVTWSADPAATQYSLRVNNTADDWGGFTDLVNCATAKGDFCKDFPAGTLSHTFPVNPVESYQIWIHSRDAQGRFGPAATMPSVQCAPNCNINTAPTTINVGQAANITADFSSSTGSLKGEIFRGNTFSRIKFEDYGNASIQQTMTATWTPTAQDVGTHTIYCRAWNDAIAECRPSNLVDGPPRYACQGPKVSHTIQVVGTNTTTPTPTTGQPTVPPTSIPSGGPTPYPERPPSSCTKYSKGDANCDGNIDLADYTCWKSEYGKGIRLNNCYTADFNYADTPPVSVLDFAIWLLNFKL